MKKRHICKMKPWATFLALAGSTYAGDKEPSLDFLRYWKSGLAEIATYDVKEERYGEIRTAQSVMIFVYEETNADTRIKVESRTTPAEKTIPTLKMNRVLKFNTGLYDYSVMTSVFAGLFGQEQRRAFQPLKISMSSQEWCGNVYHQLIPRKKILTEELHSYFESEGDHNGTLALPESVLYEDELPILLRELDGPWLALGQIRKHPYIPALWKIRKSHQKLSIGSAKITKNRLPKFSAMGQEFAAVNWLVEVSGETWHYMVEETTPHRLLGWSNQKGESGLLISSIRKTYWELNHNRDETLRKEAKLRYGVGEP